MILSKKRFEEAGGLVDSSTASLKRLSLRRLRLKGLESRILDFPRSEAALLFLTGAADVEAEGPWGKMSWKALGGRDSVFEDEPTLLALPPGSLRIRPTFDAADILVGEAKLITSDSGYVAFGYCSPPPIVTAGNPWPRLVRPDDVEVRQIGEDNWLREVRVCLSGEAWLLHVGETVNPPGCWSSWPKHRLDTEKLQGAEFEEIFFYVTKPVVGWGAGVDTWALQVLQGKYCNGEEVDGIWRVRSGDVGVMPLGFHPVVAAPDAWLWYAWFYVGKEKQYGDFADESAYL